MTNEEFSSNTIEMLQGKCREILNSTIVLDKVSIHPIAVEAYYWNEETDEKDRLIDDFHHHTSFQNQSKRSLYFNSGNPQNYWRVDYTYSENEKEHISFLLKIALFENLNHEYELLDQMRICEKLKKILGIDGDFIGLKEIKEIRKEKDYGNLKVFKRRGLTEKNDGPNHEKLLAVFRDEDSLSDYFPNSKENIGPFRLRKDTCHYFGKYLAIQRYIRNK